MKKYITTVIVFVVLANPVFANLKYYQTVQATAETYRVECDIDDMKIITNEDGSKSFYLSLTSNRNNYEMVLLVGYIAAGYAVKTGFEPANVFISVDVPVGEGFRMVSSADMTDIKKVTSGEIDTAEFIRLIQYF